MLSLKKELVRLTASFHGTASVHIQSSDWGISINDNKKMKSASLIKLAILLECFEQMKSGEISSHQLVRIFPEVMTEGAGILSHLTANREYSVQDLLTLMITISDNTATNVLIDMLGMDRINETCKQTGCLETRLQRKMMDFSSTYENWISARDVVLLFKRMMAHSLSSEMLRILRAQQFRHKLPALMDLQLTAANKTGELPGVEHDAAIIMKEGREPVFAAVLLTEFTNPDEALLLHRKIGMLLSQYMMNNLSSE